ncbi:MAG: superoxide dismutase family protein [Clostridia bacterium]|nr:superoxide dismutase family protein [Clostridia bacterium]
MRIDFNRPDAVAHVKGGEDAPRLSGEIQFIQKRDGVLVVARVSGLPRSNRSGFFGFHIHEGKSCRGEDFSATGDHYNPAERRHPKHAGDLPPLLSCGGDAYMAVMTNRFCVRDIIGRTVVIHSDSDDFHTQPSGDAGEKIACGVIRRA